LSFVEFTVLYSLDSFIKNCFKRFKLDYEKHKVKSFTKTYFALKDKNNKYIPKYGKSKISSVPKAILKSLEDDVEFY